MILSKQNDRERLAVAQMIGDLSSRILTATVSYVGKANFKGAEKYIRDFRLWTQSTGDGILIEISAVNGKFTLDFFCLACKPSFFKKEKKVSYISSLKLSEFFNFI